MGEHYGRETDCPHHFPVAIKILHELYQHLMVPEVGRGPGSSDDHDAGVISRIHLLEGKRGCGPCPKHPFTLPLSRGSDVIRDPRGLKGGQRFSKFLVAELVRWNHDQDLHTLSGSSTRDKNVFCGQAHGRRGGPVRRNNFFRGAQPGLSGAVRFTLPCARQ
ncbi:MAG: hypothetical protein A4E40_00977 [Methanoregulaceae archaeon PtaU1.Bin059]|nr:MAG: hypothetical protein A4E40_00977 [Methanoregulaceae archaeon PtaU1.Bin059]